MPDPTLRTEGLVLRPFVPADAPDLQRLAGAYEVAVGTLNMPHPYEDGMAEEWIESQREAGEEGGGLVFAITTETDGLVGAVGIEIVAEHQRAELGYWVGVPYWGRGYATEACAAVRDYAFDVLGLNRLEAQHFTRNPASGRVMEKIGMRFEGIKREHFVRFGEFVDVAVYGMLNGDPPQDT